MSIGRFLRGLAATLLPVVVCFGALIAIAALLNSRPQAGPVVCGIDRLWAMPDGQLEYRIDYSGGPVPAAGPPPPVDVVILLDQSGSMANVSALLPEAVRRATAVLARPDNANRFALAYFSDSYNIVQSWTADRALVVKAAQTPLAGGGTYGAQAFAAVDQLLGQADSGRGRRRAILLLTDAEFGDTATLPQVADRVRNVGAEIFVLLTPNENDPVTAARLTGSPEHVVTLDNEAELAERLEKMFARLVSNSSGIIRATVQTSPATFPLDAGHALAGDWSAEGGTGLSAVEPRSGAGASFLLPLEPEEIGLWPVGLLPAQVSSVDNNGVVSSSSCAFRPWVLVAPPWLLLIALLPAILWIVQAIQSWLRKPRPLPVLPIPPAAVEPFVRSLTLPVPPAAVPQRLIPTLVAGVGARGRHVSDAVVAELRDFDAAPRPHTVNIVGARAMPARQVAEDAAVHAMPSQFADVASYLPAPGDPLPADLAWFDPNAFHDVHRDGLNIAGAGADNRILNRYAFLRWLDGGLRAAVTDAADAFNAEARGAGQVLIVADVNEAFASACALDIARILRAATAERPIDISLLLLNEGGAPGQENRAAFLAEFQSENRVAALSALSSGSGDRGARRALVDHLLQVEGRGGTSESEASQVILTLLRSEVAAKVYSQSRTLRSEGTGGALSLRLCAAKVGFRVQDLSEAVALEMFQRWTVGSVLGAVEPDSNGGYRLVPARAQGGAIIDEMLKDKGRHLSEGTAAMLLAAAVAPDARDFAAIACRSAQPDAVSRLAVNALDEIVQCIGRNGFRMTDALAIASAACAAIQGDGFAQSYLALGGAPDGLELLRATFIPLMEDCCNQLQTGWAAPALERVGRAFRAQDLLLQGDHEFLERGLGRKINRALINELADELNGQLTSGRENGNSAAWVTLRTRLDNDRSQVEGHIAIAEHSATTSPAAFLDALTQRADAAVHAMHQYSLGWLLDRDSEIAMRLAARLTLEPGVGGTAIVIEPFAPDFNARAEVARLVRGIARLSGSSEPDIHIAGNDPQWLRRLAFAPAAPEPAVVSKLVPAQATLAEAAAERARARLESHLGWRVPPFPAPLRAAFVDRDAILRFARLYAADRIQQTVDDFGLPQWSCGSLPLTFGRNATLADAVEAFAVLGVAADDALSGIASDQALATHLADTADMSGDSADAAARRVLLSALQGSL